MWIARPLGDRPRRLISGSALEGCRDLAGPVLPRVALPVGQERLPLPFHLSGVVFES